MLPSESFLVQWHCFTAKLFNSALLVSAFKVSFKSIHF